MKMVLQAPFHWHHEVPCEAGDVGVLLVAGDGNRSCCNVEVKYARNQLKQAFDL